jgi:hypothetical protein
LIFSSLQSARRYFDKNAVQLNLPATLDLAVTGSVRMP